MTESRRCSRCYALYPPELVEAAFRPNHNPRSWDISRLRKRLVCRPCEQTTRDKSKRDDRWRVKARGVITHHAKSLGIDRDRLVDEFGWDPKRLASEAEHQYGNGCSYCGDKYEAMGHGLWDITLDVIHRDREPYYGTNTKWCCATCNRTKGTIDPEGFEKRRRVWKVYAANQQHPHDPIRDDPDSLFFSGGDR